MSWVVWLVSLSLIHRLRQFFFQPAAGLSTASNASNAKKVSASPHSSLYQRTTRCIFLSLLKGKDIVEDSSAKHMMSTLKWHAWKPSRAVAKYLSWSGEPQRPPLAPAGPRRLGEIQYRGQPLPLAWWGNMVGPWCLYQGIICHIIIDHFGLHINPVSVTLFNSN